MYDLILHLCVAIKYIFKRLIMFPVNEAMVGLELRAPDGKTCALLLYHRLVQSCNDPIGILILLVNVTEIISSGNMLINLLTAL